MNTDTLPGTPLSNLPKPKPVIKRKFMRMNGVLNLMPSQPDHRDFKYIPSIAAPLNADLRPQCPPIMDQGQIGSCSGNAWAAAYDFAAQAQGRIGNASRLFIYWNERAVEGDPHVDAGATTLRDGCQSLLDKGVCTEDSWPYDEAILLTCPPSSSYGEAYNRKIKGYVAVDKADIKASIAEGIPVVFGAAIFESFESAQTAASGIVTMPQAFEQALGGHALLIVGYDDLKQWYIFRNSWGPGWGDQGYGYIPYDYINSFLVYDTYSLRL